MRSKLIVLAIILFGLWLLAGSGPSYDLNQVASKSSGGGASLGIYRLGEYQIEELQKFEITARVLGKERYRFGREAELSPVDLALGWGPMAEQSVLQHIDVSQSNRWYYWRANQLPIPRRELETHSANMHIIPRTEYIEGKIDDLEEGDLITLSGSLVAITTKDGWRWISSLTREDTGQGACELFWVDDVRTVSR